MANSRKSVPLKATRSASEPFIFHTGEDPYVLSMASFREQAGSTLQRSRTPYSPVVKLLSHAGDTIRLLLAHEKSRYEMTVQIEPFRLSCSCSCNAQVETVCLHIYKALEKLSGFRGIDYFSNFSPSGIVTLARKYPSCFTKEASGPGNGYIPKTHLGQVYLFSQSRYPLFERKSVALPVQSPASMRKREICFVILTCYRRDRFPSIISCSGQLDKLGNSIKRFDPFLSNPQLMTADQQALTKLGLTMWKLVEKLPGTFRHFNDEHTKLAEKLLQLWERALPALSLQTFLYRYRLSWTRELRQKPRRNEMAACSMSKDRPALLFVLADRGNYYQFYPELKIRDKSYRVFSYAAPLLIIIKNKFYLLNSLRDAAILETMEKVTVFKEQFPAFESDVLGYVQQHYTVRIISRKNKKK